MKQGYNHGIENKIAADHVTNRDCLLSHRIQRRMILYSFKPQLRSGKAEKNYFPPGQITYSF